MLVQPELDKRMSAKALKDTENLYKKLSKVKLNWSQLSKESVKNVKQLRDIADAAEAFSTKLSQGAKKSFKELSKLGDELEEAQEKASEFRDQMNRAKTASGKKHAAAGLASAQKQIMGLNKQIKDHKEISKSYGKELTSVIRAQKNYKKSLEKAANYSGKNFLEDVTSGLKSGGKGGLLKVLGASARMSHANIARKGLAAGAGGSPAAAAGASAADASAVGLADASMAMARVVPVLAAVAAAVGAVWKVITAASDHQTKLNKVLTDGTGTVNDFVKNTDAYRQTIDELRTSAQANSYEMLKFGKNSEDTLKIVNAYAKTSTGSLIKTRDTLASLGGGSVTVGMNNMAKISVAYGKALGMEATEVASMMGSFTTETGYSAGLIQDAMGNIVKSAATANMPMTKFMDIFRRVLPDVELYQNRLEELTGTIKLLSKSMSPKDVQNFMDAFAKGFQGVDFKQRLKTVLITGTGFVSKTLDKDFGMKAKVMAQNFSKYGIKPDEFEKAYKGGTKSMADLISRAQGSASQQGEKINGTVISNAMKLASYEAARKKGGALNLATAMRGGGMYATYKILKQQSQTFVKGFDGLSEHVIKQTGITEQQYEALRSTDLAMQGFKSELSMYGKTSSVSMNKGLRQAIAMRKHMGNLEKVTEKDLVNATEEDLFTASQMADDLKETQQTAEDLAIEQTTATLSISEKLDNVIGFLLEKIFTQLTFLVDIVDKLYSWTVGSDDTKEMIKSIDEWNNRMQGSDTSEGIKSQFDYVAEVLKKGTDYTSDKVALSKYLAESPALKNVSKLGSATMFAAGQRANVDESEMDEFVKILKNKNAGESDSDNMKRALGAISGDKILPLFKQLGWDASRVFGETEEAKQRRLDKTRFRREGFKELAILKNRDALNAASKSSDTERNLIPIKDRAKSDVDKKLVTTLDEVLVKGNVPGAGPAGVPQTKSSDSSKKMVTTEDQEDATETIADAQKDSAEIVEDKVQDVYKGVTDVVTLLKKGIILNSSFLLGPYKSVLKDSTLDSFRTGLAEFSTIMAKIMTDDEFATQVGANAFGIQDAGLTLKQLGTIGGASSHERIDQLIKENAGRGHQSGGAIPQDMYTKVHKGEAVLDAMTYESVKRNLRGGGSGGTNVNITIHAAPNWSKQEFEGAVVNVMDRVARRQ